MIRRAWLRERADQGRARAVVTGAASSAPDAIELEALVAETEVARPSSASEERALMGPDGKVRLVNVRKAQGVHYAILAAELLEAEPEPKEMYPRKTRIAPKLPPGVVIPGNRKE